MSNNLKKFQWSFDIVDYHEDSPLERRIVENIGKCEVKGNLKIGANSPEYIALYEKAQKKVHGDLRKIMVTIETVD